jgi:hypothetical protein
MSGCAGLVQFMQEREESQYSSRWRSGFVDHTAKMLVYVALVGLTRLTKGIDFGFGFG